jgi:hypothetical protein
MFGTLPARGFFIRHARNIEFSNVEIATAKADERPVFWMHEVDGVDIFRVKAGKNTPAYLLRDVKDFRTFGSKDFADRTEVTADRLNF